MPRPARSPCTSPSVSSGTVANRSAIQSAAPAASSGGRRPSVVASSCGFADTADTSCPPCSAQCRTPTRHPYSSGRQPLLPPPARADHPNKACPSVPASIPSQHRESQNQPAVNPPRFSTVEFDSSITRPPRCQHQFPDRNAEKRALSKVQLAEALEQTRISMRCALETDRTEYPGFQRSLPTASSCCSRYFTYRPQTLAVLPVARARRSSARAPFRAGSAPPHAPPRAYAPRSHR